MGKLMLFTMILFLFILNAFSQDLKIPCVVQLGNCKLFEFPGSPAIKKISKGSKVDVIGVIEGYIKVVHQRDTGFILDLFINDPEVANIMKKHKADKIAEQQEQIKNEENWKKKQRDAREKILTEKYGELHAFCIIARKVMIGMTMEEVKESWGAPDDINRTIIFNETSEQWIYEGENYKNRYLYFRNGILETIQE